jgi:hypothetical protein
MQRALRIALVPACGAAIALKPPTFMALIQTESEAECSDHLYTGPSADEYRKMCSDIDADCKARCDALLAKHNAHLKELEAECKRQKRILAGNEEDHADEKSDRKEEDTDVASAKKAVAEKAHCRPELFQAKEDLAQQETIPNDDNEAIDEECRLKKLVMEKERCVEELKSAEAVLGNEKSQHSKESQEEDQAASKLPPQERKVQIACDAWKNAGGPPPCNCGGQGKKDALLAQADKAVADLLAEYLRQKGILGGQQDDHAGEKADADVERKDVKEAKEVVAKDAHCPPELEQAKASLAREDAIPNDTPANVDDECDAKKAVLKAQACVDRLRKAEAVLAAENDQHAEESSEEAAAAAKLPPQEKLVCELKAALDAAKAARKALPCDQPAPVEKSEPAPKSGATRATALVFAALLCAFVQA